MYNNSANQDLLNQINQLRQQVTSLQASIEQLQHDNAQLKQSAQDQYLDLDSRLNRLEGGNAAPALPPVPATAPKATPAPATPAAAATSERPPSVHGRQVRRFGAAVPELPAAVPERRLCAERAVLAGRELLRDP
ncbi:hypothetical protein G6F22_019533 [Rhizopus arrhizus]|nr:hypothetical protein G6F22_019533 [Rhizopus arrhizus]